MKASPHTPRLVSAVAALLTLALLVAGCGGSYGDSSSSSSTADPQTQEPAKSTQLAQDATAADNPTAAMQEFLDALRDRDAEAFCRLTEPDIQRDNFKTGGLPLGRGCVENAEALFAYERDGAPLFWEAAAQVTIGTVDLKCKPTEPCKAAVVEVRDLPLRGGGTTNQSIPMTFRNGQWRLGPT